MSASIASILFQAGRSAGQLAKQEANHPADPSRHESLQVVVATSGRIVWTRRTCSSRVRIADGTSFISRSWNIERTFQRALLVSVWRQAYGDWLARGGRDGEDAQIVERLLLLVTHIEETAMRRMTSWFESVRRRFGSVTGAKSRRHGSGGTRRLTPAFVESLEDRCLLTVVELDPSFGVGGVVTTSIGIPGSGQSMVIQTDGKVVVAGTTTHNTFVVARYNTNGSLDTSFDGDGVTTTNIGLSTATSVAVQGDGKIVVAGSSVGITGNYSQRTVFTLARFNSDGSLDSRVTFDFAGGADHAAYGVVSQGDGVVAVGSGLARTLGRMGK